MLTPLISRTHKTLALVAFAIGFTLPANARGPDVSKYPLRIQVLASTAHSRLPADPFAGGGDMPQVEGFEMPSLMGVGLQLSYNIPVYDGRGWGDLVSSEVPQALTFSYDNCLNRIAVSMAKEPLAARWKKNQSGRVLEALVPLEVIPSPRHPERMDVVKYDKCDMPVTLYTYVYLLLRDGSLARVSRQGYLNKPSLRQFVEVTPILKTRPALTRSDPPATQE
ncbi:MAG: hypothetical protein ABI197_10095 [Granulicella sp.]